MRIDSQATGRYLPTGRTARAPVAPILPFVMPFGAFTIALRHGVQNNNYDGSLFSSGPSNAEAGAHRRRLTPSTISMGVWICGSRAATGATRAGGRARKHTLFGGSNVLLFQGTTIRGCHSEHTPEVPSTTFPRARTPWR